MNIFLKKMNKQIHSNCQNTVWSTEWSKNGASEVKIMNRCGFNFDVVPSLVRIIRPLIYQELEVHGGTCDLKRRSWGFGGLEQGSEIQGKKLDD